MHPWDIIAQGLALLSLSRRDRFLMRDPWSNILAFSFVKILDMAFATCLLGVRIIEAKTVLAPGFIDQRFERYI